MRILYLNFNSELNSGVNVNRVFEILKFLSKKGIEIVHVTPYKAFKVKNVYNLIISPSKNKPGKFLQLYCSFVKTLYSTRDNYQEEDWANDLIKYFKENKKKLGNFDIIYVNTNPVSLIEAGLIGKILFNAKLVVDYQDPFALDPYRLNLPIFDFILRRKELEYLKNVDYLIVNQPSAVAAHKQIYPFLKIKGVTNITPSYEISSIKHRQNIREYKILYGGSLYIGRDLFLLLEAVKYFKEKFIVEVMGNISLINKIRYHSYPGVIWKSRIPPDQYIKYLIKEVDIGVVLQSFKVRTSMISALASKTFEYLSFNKPIIYIGPEGDNSKIIRKYSNNYCLVTDINRDKNKLRNYLNQFKSREKNTKDVYFREYTSEKIYTQLLNIFYSLINP